MGKFDKEGYQLPKTSGTLFRFVFSTALMTLAVFVILPFTQVLTSGLQDTIKFRSVDIAPPPPPPPPPDPPPPPEEEVEVEKPELEQEQQQLSLSQLESALNPGIGNALAGAFKLDTFGVALDITADIKMFSISKLDKRPRRLKVVAPQFPPEFQMAGYKGRVRVKIKIDEEGQVSILEIVSADHFEAVQPVKQALSRWLFESPTKGGQKVQAFYIQPMGYDFSE